MDLITADKVREMDERERERNLITLREELMMLYSQQTGGVSQITLRKQNF